MALEHRDLKAGQKLVARYKGQEYSVLVLAGENDALAFELDSKTIFKSLSMAGNAVTGGSVNGWRFWSSEGALKPKANTLTTTRTAKPESKVKQIRRVPNQKSVEDGKMKWHCSACMKSFLADVAENPQACPEGHTRETADEFAAAE